MNTLISLIIGLILVVAFTYLENLCRRKGWNENLLIKKLNEHRERKIEKWLEKHGKDKYGNTVVDISKL